MVVVRGEISERRKVQWGEMPQSRYVSPSRSYLASPREEPQDPPRRWPAVSVSGHVRAYHVTGLSCLRVVLLPAAQSVERVVRLSLPGVSTVVCRPAPARCSVVALERRWAFCIFPIRIDCSLFSIPFIYTHTFTNACNVLFALVERITRYCRCMPRNI